MGELEDVAAIKTFDLEYSLISHRIGIFLKLMAIYIIKSAFDTSHSYTSNVDNFHILKSLWR